MISNPSINKLSGFIFSTENHTLLKEYLRTMIVDTAPSHLLISKNTGFVSSPDSPVENTHLIAAVHGTPFWKDAELSQASTEQGASQALLAAYQKYPEDFLHYMHGHFSFAIFDKRSEKLTIGIDRIGVHSLHFYLHPDHNSIVFSSDVTDLIKHPAVSTEVSDQGIFNYLYFHMVPSPGSIYTGINKLSPAQCLVFQDGKVNIQGYWQPAFSELQDTSFDDLSAELKATLSESIMDAAEKSANIGCFLSGGIDSSTVVGTLSALTEDPVKTFSIGFDAEGYDETPYARMVAERFATDHHEYYVTPDDVVNFVPEMAAAYAEPFGNASAIPAYFCARLARENGIDVLLAGDGGDEIFAGNERYAKQALFERYSALPHVIRKHIVEPTLSLMPGTDSFTPLRKLASYIQQANIPLPDRLETYNFLHRISIDQVFQLDFLRDINADEPIDLIRNRYDAPASATTLNRMLYLDWKFTLADNDIRKVTHMATLAGTKVVYPLLSDSLINFSCRVPSRQKLNNNNLRYFFKRAMSDLLPRQVINKKKHGFGLPFGVWMKEHKPLQELAYDSITQLKNRKYFQSKFIVQAIDLHRTGHTAYYGGLIWVLMVLELWLSAHTNNADHIRVR